MADTWSYENVRDDIVAVGTASILVSAAQKRSEVVITNTSPAAEKVTLSFGKPAVATAGVVLLPYAVWFASNTSGFNVYQGDIYAVSDGAAGQISVFMR